ncbi:F-box only protein 39-like [Cololabis saira]|uniref:F-box only protein 39-like n=1 Tax=Cololabis saira TaxID=129043 RepID=UPI002AD231A5|nr:F-box only protein 39-like [Cololabis saira]
MPRREESRSQLPPARDSPDRDRPPRAARPRRWWHLLPDLCLLQVFRFLPDRDCYRAALVCRHWHQVLRSPCLWTSRRFHFSGRLSLYRPPECSVGVGYVRSLGRYLERLEVYLDPPRIRATAQRLQKTLCGLLAELIRVKAPLQSFSLLRLELDRASWGSECRDAVINSLIQLFLSGPSKLTRICLGGMHNNMEQAQELLSTLVHHQNGLSPHGGILSLDLVGFFSPLLALNPNASIPPFLQELQGLTDLGLSYSCLTQEVLMVLRQSRRGQHQGSGRDGNVLRAFSVLCTYNELHREVDRSSWAALALSCPDLRVNFCMEQVINEEWQAFILVPEITLHKFEMTAFYSPDEPWSAKPLLRDILPQHRHSLQHLTLDLCNFSESLDDELLNLVCVCENLVDLRVFAVLEINTVGTLLEMRTTKRILLNKIEVGTTQRRFVSAPTQRSSQQMW